MCSTTPAGRLVLPTDLTAPSLARRFLAQVRCAQHDNHNRDDAALVVTELVSNAVRHAGPPFELQVDCGHDELHLQVRDGDPSGLTASNARQDEEAGQDEEGGRGLALICALTSSWGFESEATGKSVWARLRLTESSVS